MNESISTRTIFSIVIISVFAAFLVGGFVGYWGKTALPEEHHRWFETLSLFLGQGLMILPIYYFLSTKKFEVKKALRLNPVSKNVAYASFPIALGVIILVDEFDRLISIVIPPPESLLQMSTQLKFDGTFAAFLLWVTIIIIAPIGEELVFRGFLQRSLERIWKDVTKAVLITSMVFAMVHLNPFWIIQIYVLGVVLGYLSWRTKSVLPGIIVHGLNNGLALVLSQDNFTGFESIYTFHGHVSPIWILVGGIALFLGFKLLHESTEALA